MMSPGIVPDHNGVIVEVRTKPDIQVVGECHTEKLEMIGSPPRPANARTPFPGQPVILAWSVQPW